jgi:flavin-binding protein dodecin
MSVAKVIEISSQHPKGFEEAIREGVARAAQTVSGIRGAWVQEQHVDIVDGKITAYRVNLKITFLLENAKKKR